MYILQSFSPKRFVVLAHDNEYSHRPTRLRPMGKDSEMEAEEGFSKPAIEALSEDLLAGSIFSRLSLGDKFRVELVCKHWNRLMHTVVWPMQSRPTLPPLEGTIAPTKNSTSSNSDYHQSALAALFRRCHASVMELELLFSAETFPSLPPSQLIEVLSKFDFPSLRHLHLTTDSPIGVEELERIASHRSAAQLLTLSLDVELRTQAADSTTIGHGSAGVDLGDYFARFSKLEALVITTPSPPHPVISALPATLKYLSIRLSETRREGAAVDAWLRVAARDCSQLEVCRLMPRGNVAGVAWWFGGDCHGDEEWRNYVETAPSPEAIELLGGLVRLAVLQIAIGDGREEGASTHALRAVLAKLGRQLRAVAISSPTIGALNAIAEHCAPSLEHLSFANSRHFLVQVVDEGFMTGSLFRQRPEFPALRSLEIKRLPQLVAKSFLIKIFYDNIERLYFGSSMFVDYGFNFLFLERTLPKLSLLAATLSASNLLRISEILSLRDSAAPPVNDSNQLAFYPCFMKSEPYQRDLPNVRILQELPTNNQLGDVLFGSLTSKPHFFEKQYDWWQE